MPAPPRNAHLALHYRQHGYWAGRPLFPFFVETCERLGEREALVDGGRRLSFAEFHSRVRDLERGLARLGVRSGTTVSVQLPNWWETAALAWALIGLGAVLNPILPIYRSRDLEFILAEAGTEILIVPGFFRGFDHRSLAAGLVAKIPTLRHVVVVRGEPEAGQLAFDDLSAGDLSGGRASVRADDSGVRGEDVFLLMYTSGTTAEPKGVLHTHDTLLYELRSLGKIHGLDDRDTVLMPSPLTHISGLIHGVLLPFLLGTRAVLMDAWEPARALEIIERESVTYMVGAPIFLSDLTVHPDLPKRPTRTLRLFSCGGAGVSPDLILESRRRLGCVSKRVYGSTEFPTLTTTGAEDSREHGAATEGRAIWAAEVDIVDDDGNPVPRGREGEIFARGPECFIGYQNPDLDREAFAPGGWFRTGDLGVLDADGYLTVTGRKKDIVIRKGEKISAAEVETVIARHPSVLGVAVIAMPDRETGERACACIELRSGASLSLGELCGFLLDLGLARQKLPESLEVLSSLPRTASGKVQKHRLKEMFT
jgi:non-ribosomal peptide synthetase component E (peptide arylation enzyme)